MKGNLKYDELRLHLHILLDIIPDLSGVWFCRNRSFNQIDYICGTEQHVEISLSTHL
jgi:hypothetical protein